MLNVCIDERIKVGGVAVNDETNNSIPIIEGTDKLVVSVEDGCILAGIFRVSIYQWELYHKSPIPLAASGSSQNFKMSRWCESLATQDWTTSVEEFL